MRPHADVHGGDRGKRGEGSLGAAPGAEDRFLVVHGLRYRVRLAGEGRPLLVLHGFTGSVDAWCDHLATLAAHHRLIAVDLPGHGRTGAVADPSRYHIEPLIADLLELIDRLVPAVPPAGRRPAVRVLGYSMGGRAALHLALAAPERVSALVLESASPGIADPTERAARAAADCALADRIEREGLPAFVRYWETLPLFTSQRTLPRAVLDRQRAQRLAGSAAGLANSLRGFGAGVPAPLQARLGELAMPVGLIAGALDGRYAALALRMAERIRRAEVAIVPNAGHAVHLERPAAFDRAVAAYLRTIDDEVRGDVPPRR